MNRMQESSISYKFDFLLAQNPPHILIWQPRIYCDQKSNLFFWHESRILLKHNILKGLFMNRLSKDSGKQVSIILSLIWQLTGKNLLQPKKQLPFWHEVRIFSRLNLRIRTASWDNHSFENWQARIYWDQNNNLYFGMKPEFFKLQHS